MMGFRNFPVAKKIMGKRREGVSRFSVECFFCDTGQKKFIGERFRVSLNRLSKNCILKSVMSEFFVVLLLSRKTEKHCKGLFCAVFRKVSVTE